METAAPAFDVPLDIMRSQELLSWALSTEITDGHGDEPIPVAPAEALGSSSADAALQAGYTGALRSVPTAATRMLVRATGATLALRLAPRTLLDVPGITLAGSGPGWIRLRCAGATAGRRQCLERQGTILALPARFGLEPFILEDASCIARGDAECEYLLHHRSRPRWAAIVAVAVAGSALGAIMHLQATSVLLLGLVGAAAVFALERLRSSRTDAAMRIVSSRALRRLVNGARAGRPTGPAPIDAPVEVPAALQRDRDPVLAQEGDVWRITYEGTTIRVRHSRGLALLSLLLRHPGEELHVQMLDSLVPSAGAGNERTPVNPDALPANGMSIGFGDAGPVIDERARADYRRRLAELRRELEDAERCNDPGRATAARVEMEQLGDELRAATGLGGRARRASSDVDRVRIAVSRRIRAAIEQLGKLHPALGEHLDRSIRTGFTCCYSPVEHPERSR
jgi:hypothetical protein